MKQFGIAGFLVCVAMSGHAQDWDALDQSDLLSALENEMSDGVLDAQGMLFFQRDRFNALIATTNGGAVSATNLRALGAFNSGAFLAEGVSDGFVNYQAINAARNNGDLLEYVIYGDDAFIMNLIDQNNDTSQIEMSLKQASDAFGGLKDLSTCQWVYSSSGGKRRCTWVCSDASVFGNALDLE